MCLCNSYHSFCTLYNVDTISDAIRQAPRTRKRRAQLMTPSPFNRKFLLEVLLPIQHKWKFIGIALGVEFTTLHRISERYPTQAKEALLEVIEEWLNSDLPSWEGLLEALRTSTVGEDRLAGETGARCIHGAHDCVVWYCVYRFLQRPQTSNS